jgi:ACS family allantoate permease-like MFS transporter
MITLVVYRIVLRRENARRDREQQVSADEVDDDGKAEQMGVALDSDLTDKQDVKFRYTL